MSYFAGRSAGDAPRFPASPASRADRRSPSWLQPSAAALPLSGLACGPQRALCSMRNFPTLGSSGTLPLPYPAYLKFFKPLDATLFYAVTLLSSDPSHARLVLQEKPSAPPRERPPRRFSFVLRLARAAGTHNNETATRRTKWRTKNSRSKGYFSASLIP